MVYAAGCTLFLTLYEAGDLADGVVPRWVQVTGKIVAYSYDTMFPGERTVWLADPENEKFRVGRVRLPEFTPADLGKLATGMVQRRWFAGGENWIGPGRIVTP